MAGRYSARRFFGFFRRYRITFVHLVSEEWTGGTNKDGTGLYWELARAVYEPLNIRLQSEIVRMPGG